MEKAGRIHVVAQTCTVRELHGLKVAKYHAKLAQTAAAAPALPTPQRLSVTAPAFERAS